MEETQEFEYIEASSNEEIIAACCNALGSTSDIDTALMSTADKNRVARIRRKSLRMMAECIDEMYSLMFDEEEE